MRAFAPLAFLVINAPEALQARIQGSRPTLLGLGGDRVSHSRRLQEIATGPFPTSHATLHGQFVIKYGPVVSLRLKDYPATYTCIKACQLAFPGEAIYGGSTGTCWIVNYWVTSEIQYIYI